MTFKDVVDKLVLFADKSVVPLLFALAFLFFLIGLARFFLSQSDENRQKGRQLALWGLIALIVMFSLWGIVNLFLNALING